MIDNVAEEKGVFVMAILKPSKNLDRVKFLADIGNAMFGHGNVPNRLPISSPSKELKGKQIEKPTPISIKQDSATARTLTPSKYLDRDKFLADIGNAMFGHNNVPNRLPISSPSKEKAKEEAAAKVK